MNNSFFYGLKKNVVDDADAPAYFSQRAIFWFSILFSAIAGSVLFCFNLKGKEHKKGIITVLIFGLLFTVLQVAILSNIRRSSALTFIFSSVAGYLLTSFFWKRYIGADVMYRARPIWIPLIIVLIMMIPFIFAAFYGGEL